MSLKKNVLANYSSQVFIIGISILTLPLLLKWMGPEAYGLVGFFSLIQSLLSFLDLGMSPTMSREIARFRGGVIEGNQLNYLYQKLKQFFAGLGLLFLIGGFIASSYIATSWLNIETLNSNTVLYAVNAIVLVVFFRWFSGFYKAVLTGFEELMWLSSFNGVVGFLRFLFVFVPLFIFGATPEVFFTFQLIIALLEFLVVARKAKLLLPQNDVNKDVKEHKVYLKSALKFAVSIAFTSAVWVAITQIDKLILSKLLKLSEFGYFTLAVQLAGGIMMISGPISSAIIPRMAKLEAEGKHADLIQLYKNATQLIVVFVGTVALLIMIFSKEVLFIWSGNEDLVNQSNVYLYLYAVGNFLLSMSAFPYYLQYAKGNLKFHIIGNIIFLVILVPTLIYVVSIYGGVGAGYVWVCMNVFYFVVWVPVVHRYFDKTLNVGWYRDDIAKLILPMLAVAFLFKWVLLPETHNRVLTGVYIGVIGLIIVAVGMGCSSYIKRQWPIILQQLRKR